MRRYNEHIETLELYSGTTGELSSVCGVIRSKRFVGPRLFSIRGNNASWTLRGLLFPNQPYFPTWQDALQYIVRMVAD